MLSIRFVTIVHMTIYPTHSLVYIGNSFHILYFFEKKLMKFRKKLFPIFFGLKILEELVLELAVPSLEKLIGKIYELEENLIGYLLSAHHFSDYIDPINLKNLLDPLTLLLNHLGQEIEDLMD